MAVDIRNEECKTFARFAKSAYKSSIKEKQDILRQNPNTSSYKIDTFLSDENFTILRNNNEIIMAIKGTNSTKDIVDDIFIFFGLEGDSFLFNKTKDKLKKIKIKYPHAKISVTGHSLGGTMTSLLEESTLKSIISKGVSFNEGKGARGLIYRPAAYNSNNSAYFVKGDPISVLAIPQSKKEKKTFILKQHKQAGWAHTINQFL